MRAWSDDELSQLHNELRNDLNVDRIRRWQVMLRKVVLHSYVEYGMRTLGVELTEQEMIHAKETMYKALMYK